MAFTSSFGGVFMVSSLHVCLMVLLWTGLHLGWGGGGGGGEGKGGHLLPLGTCAIVPEYVSKLYSDWLG